jgi:hypothetical protein
MSTIALMISDVKLSNFYTIISISTLLDMGKITEGNKVLII